jgi:subtilisin family serine protease
MTPRAPAAVLLLALAGAACSPPGAAVSTSLDEAIRSASPGEELAVVVRLVPSSDRPAIAPGGRLGRSALVSALRASGARSEARVRSWLERRGARRLVSLWAIDAIALRAPVEVIRELRGLPGVLEVQLDVPFAAPSPAPGTAATPEWNLAAVRAPELWGRALDGTGAVVAILDTGVALEHQDLAPGFRGGPGDWFDPFLHSATPYDPLGHGTQALGVAVGGSAGGTAIGVAPGASWIAAKIYDDAGRSSASVIHQALQWALDPDGDPSTSDAPDVLNASWGSLAAGTCDLTFQPDLEVLRAAGVAVIVAAGNMGPSPSSSVSPANNPGAFSAGAVDSTGLVADFSSRGPSACGGTVFPDLVAPGVDVWTADRPVGGVSQYVTVSGTSVAAPHVAGAAALLLGAFPDTPVPQLEEALRAGARDLLAAGPDNDAGSGMLDVVRAHAQLARRDPLAIVTSSLPAADEARDWSTPLEARGGVAPRAWSILAGTPPPGTALDLVSGVLAGVPASAGIFHFTVEVRDRSGQAATASYAARVDPAAPLAFGATALPGPVLGSPYLAALAVSGGARPWTFDVASGLPPPGIALDPGSGALAGTPSAAGPATFTVRVTDALGATALRDLSLDVATAPLAVTTSSLRACVTGYGCSRPIQASGGIPPYGWSLAAGAPPPGLSLDPASGALFGTPTAAGSYPLEVQAIDSSGSIATRALAITVL